MKNWKTKAVSTILALAVLVPTTAFAADVVKGGQGAKRTEGFAHHQLFNQEKKQEFNDKLLELVTKYTPDSLEEWKNALATQDQLREEMKDKLPADKQRPQLSEEVKEKVKAIQEDVKNGNLTREQAQEQLKSLGVEGFKGNFKERPQMSDEAKEKVKALREELKNGTITQEQAQEQLKSLGIEGFKGDFKGRTEMSDEVKAKVQAIREDLKKGTITQEQAQEQWKALGIKGPVVKDRPQLSDEAKQKLQTIQEDVKSGTLTKEQAQEEMKNLGLTFRGDVAKNHPMAQFQEAVKANDEAKIKELLPQMLEQLKEKNQELSNKLAESNS